MFAWISANLVNIALIAVLGIIVALVVHNLLRVKKAGKCACGCDCASCGGCAACGEAAKSPDKASQRL